jgi:hypothetical protein
MTKDSLDFFLSLAAAFSAILAAIFWIASTKAEERAAPSSQPGSGWDGYMVVLSARSRPVHLVETFRKQAIWSSRAAWSAAFAAALQAAEFLARAYS